MVGMSEPRVDMGMLKSFLSVHVHIESLMSCHLLLNLLHELANMILCEALPSIISFLPTNVINLVQGDPKTPEPIKMFINPT